MAPALRQAAACGAGLGDRKASGRERSPATREQDTQHCTQSGWRSERRSLSLRRVQQRAILLRRSEYEVLLSALPCDQDNRSYMARTAWIPYRAGRPQRTDNCVTAAQSPDPRAVSYTHLDVYKRQPSVHTVDVAHPIHEEGIGLRTHAVDFIILSNSPEVVLHLSLIHI